MVKKATKVKKYQISHLALINDIVEAESVEAAKIRAKEYHEIKEVDIVEVKELK